MTHPNHPNHPNHPHHQVLQRVSVLWGSDGAVQINIFTDIMINIQGKICMDNFKKISIFIHLFLTTKTFTIFLNCVIFKHLFIEKK